MATCREASKNNWKYSGSTEHINMGSLQRIADACELMSQSYSKLIDERELYHKMFQESIQREERLVRSNAALKGVITKIRNKNSNRKPKMSGRCATKMIYTIVGKNRKA